MAKKSHTQQTHTDKITAVATHRTASSKITPRILGVGILAMSLSVFVQSVPLLFVFLGGILGVHPDAKASDMDTMVWLLTSVTMMVLSLYVFIRWIRYVGRRFIIEARPLAFRKKLS